MAVAYSKKEDWPRTLEAVDDLLEEEDLPKKIKSIVIDLGLNTSRSLLDLPRVADYLYIKADFNNQRALFQESGLIYKALGDMENAEKALDNSASAQANFELAEFKFLEKQYQDAGRYYKKLILEYKNQGIRKHAEMYMKSAIKLMEIANFQGDSRAYKKYKKEALNIHKGYGVGKDLIATALVKDIRDSATELQKIRMPLKASEQGNVLKKMLKSLTDLKEEVKYISSFKSSPAFISALSIQSSGVAHVVKEIKEAPAPEGLKGKDLEAYNKGVKDIYAPLEKEANDLFILAKSTSEKHNILNSELVALERERFKKEKGDNSEVSLAQALVADFPGVWAYDTWEPKFDKSKKKDFVGLVKNFNLANKRTFIQKSSAFAAKHPKEVKNILNIRAFLESSTPHRGEFLLDYAHGMKQNSLDDYVYFNNKGVLTWAQGDPNGAMYWFHKAIKKNKARSEAHANLAGAMMSYGMFDAAMDHQKAAFEFYYPPAFVKKLPFPLLDAREMRRKVLSNQALVLYFANEAIQAAKIYKSVDKMSKGSKQVQLNHAIILARAGAVDKALKIIKDVYLTDKGADVVRVKSAIEGLGKEKS